MHTNLSIYTNVFLATITTYEHTCEEILHTFLSPQIKIFWLTYTLNFVNKSVSKMWQKYEFFDHFDFFVTLWVLKWNVMKILFWLYVFRNIDLCRKGCDFYNDVQIMNEQKEKLDEKRFTTLLQNKKLNYDMGVVNMCP